MHWYQHLIYANERASDASPVIARTPQIWPYFVAFVLPLLRSQAAAIPFIHAGKATHFLVG